MFGVKSADEMMKEQDMTILRAFNEKSKGIRAKVGLIIGSEDPIVINARLAKILFENRNRSHILDAHRMTNFLFDEANEDIAKSIFEKFDWGDKTFIEAINEAFKTFPLPGEASKMSSLLGMITDTYCNQYKGENRALYKDDTLPHMLIVGLVQFNKALHDKEMASQARASAIDYEGMYKVAFPGKESDKAEVLINEINGFKEQIKSNPIPVRYNETLPGFTFDSDEPAKHLAELFKKDPVVDVSAAFNITNKDEKAKFKGYTISSSKVGWMDRLFGFERIMKVQTPNKIDVASVKVYKPGWFAALFGKKSYVNLSVENEDHYDVLNTEQRYLLSKMAATLTLNGDRAEVQGTLNINKHSLSTAYDQALKGTLTLDSDQEYHHDRDLSP